MILTIKYNFKYANIGEEKNGKNKRIKVQYTSFKKWIKNKGCKMGRSVATLSRADLVLYFDGEFLSGLDEDGEYNEGIAQINWEDFYSNLKYEIKKRFISYDDCDKWDNNETNIFLENELAEIGLSEYCGLCSLSVRAKESEYYDEYSKENFGKYHISQIEKGLNECLQKCYVKILN